MCPRAAWRKADGHQCRLLSRSSIHAHEGEVVPSVLCPQCFRELNLITARLGGCAECLFPLWQEYSGSPVPYDVINAALLF